MSTLSQDAAALRDLRTRYERSRAKTEALKFDMDAAERALFERMEAEDVSGIKVGQTNFVAAATTYAQIQDRAAFVAWASEEAPELLELKERKQLINELVRERLDNGDTLPAGLGFYQREYVSQRAA